MKVLIVDDSRVIRILLTEHISALGHKTFLAENGAQCIAHLKENKVDLIIMDVNMPTMNGFETTRAIKQMEGMHWFPIIFLTIQQDESSFSQGILAGGDAYLEKPINTVKLQCTITAMERIYTMHNTLQSEKNSLLISNKKLERLAMYDPLTGLANRRNFDESLHQQFKLARRHKTPLSIIICDIDFFKIYNDTYGHPKGDECLAAVAKTMSNIPVRPTDQACRYGGEEFTIILPDTHHEGGLLIAEKLRQAVVNKNIPHNLGFCLIHEPVIIFSTSGSQW